MPRVPLTLAFSATLLVIALAGCSVSGTDSGTPDPTSAATQEPETDAPASSDGSWSADPACDDYVEQRSAAMADFDQSAEMAAIDELPFRFATTEYGWNGESVACVWRVLADGSSDPAGFELLIYAPEGDASYVVTTSPDLTMRECPSDNSVACLVDAAGDVVIVTPVGAITGAEAFASTVQGVGIQLVG